MDKIARAQLCISSLAQETLLKDVYSRKNVEACGVLLGTIDNQDNWHAEQAYPLRNVFDSPVYFEFDPEDLISVELNYPGQIIGVYHSHPTGFPVASKTDKQNMQRVNLDQQIPWVWLIISGPFNDHDIQSSPVQLTKSPMIAYHHYPQTGLQQIEIQIEQRSEEQQTAHFCPHNS